MPDGKKFCNEKSDCKNPLNKTSNKVELQRKNLTAKTPAVKNSTKEKLSVKVSTLKAKFLTAINPTKKSLTVENQMI